MMPILVVRVSAGGPAKRQDGNWSPSKRSGGLTSASFERRLQAWQIAALRGRRTGLDSTPRLAATAYWYDEAALFELWFGRKHHGHATPCQKPHRMGMGSSQGDGTRPRIGGQLDGRRL